MAKNQIVPKKPRAAVILIREGEILLIHRRKQGQAYYVLPGGGVKKRETLEAGAVRELKEETNLDVQLGPLLWTIENRGRREHYFQAESFAGTMRLGGPELEKMSDENQFRLEWVPLNRLRQITLQPEEIRLRIIARFGPGTVCAGKD